MQKYLPIRLQRSSTGRLRTQITLFLLTLLLGLPIASTTQTLDLGLPQTWSKAIVSDIPLVQMPNFDLETIKAEDLINDQFKDRPFRFGYEHQVEIDLLKEADVYLLPGKGSVYRLEVFSDEATTISLLFSQFSLPDGATLHLYGKQAKNLIGAYTALNNNPYGQLGTELISGDLITIEYFEPLAVAGQGKLQIGMVVHGYRSPSAILGEAAKALNDSGDCNHDVGCPTGNGWGDQIRSVGLLLVGGGSCSGALINNTNNDGTPYFLTARHCGSNYGGWVVRFNWESTTPICASTQNSVDPGPPYDQTANGATFRASNSGSDFTLVELPNLTPALIQQWDLYFAGWDRSDNIPTNTTGIHHPSGDVKKICRDNDASTKTTINFNGNSNAAMWTVADWDVGVTEPGSSGSPLFDQNQRIIGQLCCGAAACNGTNDNNAHDRYGRFATSWDGASETVRLKDWLDPAGTAPSFIDGIDVDPCAMDTEDPTAICPGNIAMSNDAGQCGANVTFAIDVSDNCPDATVSANPASGSFFSVGTTTVTVTATDAAGNTDECTFEVTVNDTEDPVAICPMDITEENDAGDCGAVIEFAIDVSDNCTGATVSAVPVSGSFFAVGTTPVTVTATDAAGNTDECTFMVTVNDTEDPVITACAGSTVNFNGEESFNSEDVIDFDATDNCGIASITYDPPLISCEDLGSTVSVTVTVTDIYGNPNACIADVIVDGLPCGYMLAESDCGSDADYDVPTETFTLAATNCYYANPFNQDKITFVKHELCGDGEIIADVTNIDPYGWAGIVMRETLDAGSKKIAISRDNGWYARREARTATNGPAYPQQFQAFGKNWLRLVRQGNFFIAYVSPNGVNWQQVMVANISMAECINVGLFLTNKQFSTQTISADFNNVEVNETGNGGTIQQLSISVPAVIGDISVYPNPTAGLVTVDLSAMLDKDVQLELRNTKGQLLRQLDLGRVSERRTELQLGDLPVGIYWLRVQAEREAPITKRIVIERL